MTALPAVRDPRLPDPGTTIRRGGHEVLVGTKLFKYRDQEFGSLSAIARHITGHAANGFRYFGLATKGAQEPVVPSPAPTLSSDTITEMPRESEPPKGESIKFGDPRGIRDLPVGTCFSSNGPIYIGSRSYTTSSIKLGETNPRTGAITIWIYEGRLARTPEEELNSFYGLHFYYRPLSINGEDVDRLENNCNLGNGND